MKKLKLAFVAVVTGVLLFAMTACGGASGTVSSFVSAVKKGDFDKASNYVVGTPDLSSYEKSASDSLYTYIYEKAAKSFSYSVESTSETEDDDGNAVSATVKISYSVYSGSAISITYAAKVLTGSEASKSTINDLFDDADKTTGTASVVVINDDDGWVMEAASATALIALIWL